MTLPDPGVVLRVDPLTVRAVAPDAALGLPAAYSFIAATVTSGPVIDLEVTGRDQKGNTVSAAGPVVRVCPGARVLVAAIPTASPDESTYLIAGLPTYLHLCPDGYAGIPAARLKLDGPPVLQIQAEKQTRSCKWNMALLTGQQAALVTAAV